MVLKHISLQHFRNYSKAEFSFDPQLTVIVGPNAIGKSNLVEAIGMLATGKSFRTSKEKQLITFEQSVTRISGSVATAISSTAPDSHLNEEISSNDDNEDEEKIEIVVAENPSGWLQKRYLINGVSKRRSSLQGKLPVVLFSPQDLDLVSGQPGAKRRFLDEVLEQTEPQYATAVTTYAKALRQRNALLEYVQNSGRRDSERFAYWDNLLITHGQYISEQREKFINEINAMEKNLFPFQMIYDHSRISAERLLQYKDAEVGAGVTLVGPQRDDVILQTKHPVSHDMEDVKYFCSRGQQRLVTLELKKSQISYLKSQLDMQPLLLLDDIFSELDSSHIQHVLQLTDAYQTIITTTHKEFLDTNLGNIGAVIELKK